MNSALDLSAVGGIAALGCWVIGAVNTGDFAVFVLFKRNSGEEICALKANFIAGEHTEIFFGRLLHKVALFNINLF